MTNPEGASPRLSVVIPARNEESHIAASVCSVREALGSRFTYEVLVADHGSEDRTAEVAEREGARVVPAGSEIRTIGALRNHAVRKATGILLVFIDADVTIDSTWGRRLDEVWDELIDQGKTVTGSVCRVPEPPSWIESIWFTKRLDRPTHLGTGHMVVTRAFFEELGGFDPSLSTGEDFEFCERAVASGGRIVLDPLLIAVHHGFPKTIGQFGRREVWHGRGDFASLALFFRSKVAVAATLLALLELVALGAAAAGVGWLAVGSMIGAVGLIGVSAHAKFGRRLLEAPFSIFAITWLYLSARALSPLHQVFGRTQEQR